MLFLSQLCVFCILILFFFAPSPPFSLTLDAFISSWFVLPLSLFTFLCIRICTFLSLTYPFLHLFIYVRKYVCFHLPIQFTHLYFPFCSIIMYRELPSRHSPFFLPSASLSLSPSLLPFLRSCSPSLLSFFLPSLSILSISSLLLLPLRRWLALFYPDHRHQNYRYWLINRPTERWHFSVLHCTALLPINRTSDHRQKIISSSTRTPDTRPYPHITRPTNFPDTGPDQLLSSYLIHQPLSH